MAGVGVFIVNPGREVVTPAVAGCFCLDAATRLSILTIEALNLNVRPAMGNLKSGIGDRHCKLGAGTFNLKNEGGN